MDLCGSDWEWRFSSLFSFRPLPPPSPDGLEKVAETKGFSEKGEGWTFWKYAPFSDYTLPWIKNEKVSTALSGLIGTLAIFLIALGVGKLIKKIPTKKVILFIFFPSLIFFSSMPTYAARPLTTDDAWTVEKGEFQLEAGFDALRQDNHDREYSPSLTLTYGLLETDGSGHWKWLCFLPSQRGGERKWDGRYRDQVEISMDGRKELEARFRCLRHT